MQILVQPSPVSNETIDDRVAALLQAGTNIALNYNDATNTLTITNSAPAAPDTEMIQDIIAALLVAGTNVTLNYNDTANTLTINSTASGGADTETIQDIVGAMLTDTATVDFTYDDALGTVIAGVKDGSITTTKLATMASGRLLGRGTFGVGPVEIITVSGTGLILPSSGTILRVHDALDAIATAAPIGGTFVYYTAPNNAALATLTAAGRALLDDANAEAQRITLGIEDSSRFLLLGV